MIPINVVLSKAAYPSQQNKNLNWHPGALQSKIEITCRSCQASDLHWGWNFATSRPQLLDKCSYPHDCPTPQKQDIFPGWCHQCNAPNLLWLRSKDGFELSEEYGLPHACPLEASMQPQDLATTKCRYCNTLNLLWVKLNHKFTLCQVDGKKHQCAEFSVYMKDWAEAKRMDYTAEKAWLNSIPNDFKCKKCKGNSYTTFLSKDKRTKRKYNSTEPILMQRNCLRCKRIGMFTVAKKADYLKTLRKRYWPFRGGVHKWRKYDHPGL